MIHTVAFPGLGIELEINRAITIGSLTIYWYAVIIALGFLLAIEYFFRDCKTFGIDSDRGTNVIFVSMVLGVIGARAYYVIFNWSYFSGDISKIFDIRGGGLGFYGTLIGGFIGVVIGCRIWKVPMKPFLDIVAAGLLIGQGIGRWGNFVNGECFGINTDLPWGMTGTNITSYILSHTEEEMGAQVDPFLPVHPTFLYESVWCLIGFAVFMVLRKKRRFDGEMFLFYMGWNGFGRMIIEGLRTDSLMVGGMRVSQIAGGLMVAVSLAVWLAVRSKIKKAADDTYLIKWADTEKGKLQSEGKWDYKTDRPAADTMESKSAESGTDCESKTEEDTSGENDESENRQDICTGRPECEESADNDDPAEIADTGETETGE